MLVDRRSRSLRGSSPRVSRTSYERPARSLRSESNGRGRSAHVDMDAFFVSIELLRHPELRGKPVIVAGSTNPNSRGVVMTATYEARRFGVGSAMPLATAKRRCPQAVVLPSRHRAVQARLEARHGDLSGFSDTIEVAGLDEAYLDLSESPGAKGPGAADQARRASPRPSSSARSGLRRTSCSRRSRPISTSPTASGCFGVRRCSRRSASGRRD